MKVKEIYLVDGVRSPVGNFLGSLKNLRAADIGASVLKALLERCAVTGELLDEVIVGNILSAGAGQGVGRQTSILAGVPQQVPAYSINMICGSGMKSIMLAANSINSGASLIAAGGVESMSNAPYLLPAKFRQGIKMGDNKLVDHMIFDSLTDAFSGVHMGITAENIAAQYNISRQEQDEFAINSQNKAIAAVDSGKFKEEIIPFEVTEGKTTITFSDDEYPNRTTNLEKLSKLRPAFKPDGTVTAGNASGINDGAAFVLVASNDAVKKHNLKPIAKLLAVGQAGVDPQYMGMGPVPAIAKALKESGLTLKDMDYIELNEAFAAQSIGVINQLAKEHGMTKEEIRAKCNVNGGAIALGHPVGASGSRIVVTLMHLIKHKKGTRGLASLCIGGGMGTAIILESV